jgi:peptidoglycan/xylan/chitin deacetylase (PgdA/CDA1 family)
MKKINVFLGALFLLSACTGIPAKANSNSTQTPTPFLPIVYSTAAQTRTPRPTLTSTPTVIPTPAWVVQGPGNLTIPILLYHHIGISPVKSMYYVPPKTFEQEIKALHDWGYTSITIKMLVQAITMGRELPPHPILITFDDGHVDNYTTAFPIMQKYGFTGALYIVVNFMDTEGYLSHGQILEMYRAGWDVGSHSMNHYDLTKLDAETLRREIVTSKEKLEDILGVDILTFAYPFGAKNDAIVREVRAAGYIAAMGAEGYTDSQGEWNLFNLQRVGIRGSEDAKSITRFLTWKGPSQ